MKNTLSRLVLALAVPALLIACGKKDSNYEMANLNNAATPVKDADKDARAKAIIAADKGKKVEFVCRVVNQFPSKSTADVRPVSVPELGITHKGDFMLGIVASTPEIAAEIVGMTGALLTWSVVKHTCKASG